MIYTVMSNENLILALGPSFFGSEDLTTFASSPSFVQACSQWANVSTPVTCVFTTNVTSGNLIVGYYNSPNGTKTVSAISATNAGACSTFNLNTASAGTSTLFTCPVTGTGSCTISVTAAGVADDTVISAHEVRNVTGVDNGQTVITGSIPCGSCSTATLTPTGSTDYIFVSGIDSGTFGGGTVTAGSGYTICSGSGTNTCPDGNGGYVGASEYQVLSSSGPVTPSMTWSSNTAAVPLGAMLLK